MEQVGAGRSVNASVQLHDEIAGISFRQPLAQFLEILDGYHLLPTPGTHRYVT